jgi:hypothetical protein
MTNRQEMDTLSTVLNHLKQKRYCNEFTVNTEGRVLLLGKQYDQLAISLLKTYRFEGDSDPSEQAIIYLIKTDDGTIGYSVDNYGIYTNHLNDVYAGFIQQLDTGVLK